MSDNGRHEIGAVCECPKPLPAPDGRSCLKCARVLPTTLRLSDIDLGKFRRREAPQGAQQTITPEVAHEGCANELANAASHLCDRANKHLEHAGKTGARYFVVVADPEAMQPNEGRKPT